ncbi:MAG: signal peptidase [Verrucomicrobiaceae bacterium]|nr:signal peptidase [Verrucomicrobiaceae bacterium]
MQIPALSPTDVLLNTTDRTYKVTFARTRFCANEFSFFPFVSLPELINTSHGLWIHHLKGNRHVRCSFTDPKKSGLLNFLLTFGLIRTAIADYNPIPSGSMHPTILEGDVVLVNRLAYNLKLPLTDIVLSRLGDPARGDIVTFSSPKDGVRLIERVIGLPADSIAMRDKRLLINGHPADYVVSDFSTDRAGEYVLPATRVTEKLGAHSYRVQWFSGIASASNFGPITIPADQFLMLGDNRDNSADSRFIGLVPRDLLIGRAECVLVSAAITDNWLPRFDRFGESLYK